MSNTAIFADQISKRYRICAKKESYRTLRDTLVDLAKAPARRISSLVHHNGIAKDGESIWALNGVSFEIKCGEVVGIIGRNGAGKSTLLKLLSRITEPTRGSADISGRVASLLEVGTGFHHELSGRENIYLNGSIMGMRKKEIDSKIEEIAAFAMTEKFLDTPIKHYSSGMRLRLGFAVAAHLEPDILLIDEVLAVGDAEFQKKCLKTMNDLGGGGRTVLFVSHNMAAIENLCPRTIWIDRGEVREDGATGDVIRSYMSTFTDSQSGSVDLENVEARRGNGHARFTRVEFLSSTDEPVSYVRCGDHLIIRLHFRVHQKVTEFRAGIEFLTELGLKLSGTNSWATGFDVPHVFPGDGHIDFEIDFLNFLPGRYYLSLWLGVPGDIQDVIQNCVVLDVEPSDYYKSGRGIDNRFGLVFLPGRWKSDNLPIH
jgi:lipopolysaccharide transport system ATP-binding protein